MNFISVVRNEKDELPVSKLLSSSTTNQLNQLVGSQLHAAAIKLLLLLLLQIDELSSTAGLLYFIEFLCHRRDWRLGPANDPGLCHVRGGRCDRTLHTAWVLFVFRCVLYTDRLAVTAPSVNVPPTKPHGAPSIHWAMTEQTRRHCFRVFWSVTNYSNTTPCQNTNVLATTR